MAIPIITGTLPHNHPPIPVAFHPHNRPPSSVSHVSITLLNTWKAARGHHQLPPTPHPTPTPPTSTSARHSSRHSATQ
ncbi:MAG: hypothetical protein ACFNV9_05005 [Corynebacterium matruchotii]